MQKLSVVIPNYNHAEYLPDCLDSLLSQSHKADEIIIVDDGSTDNSAEVVRSFQKNHPEIILLKNEKNLGVHLTFNRGFQATRHELIFGTSADDLIFPSFFEKALTLFDQADLALVCADFAVFLDQKPYQFKKYRMLDRNDPSILQPPEVIEVMRKTNFYIPSNTCIYKKQWLKKYGGYDSKLLSLTDLYINTQISFRHPIGYVPNSFGAFRFSASSYGKTIRKNWKLRLALMDNFVKSIEGEETPFQKAVLRSGMLSLNGFFMILYLLLHPRYWLHVPFVSYKVIKRKLQHR